MILLNALITKKSKYTIMFAKKLKLLENNM